MKNFLSRIFHYISILTSIIKGQVFLFPKINTSLLRIYGKVRVRGQKNGLHIGKRVVFLGDLTFVCGGNEQEGNIFIEDGAIFEHGCYLNAHGGKIFIGRNAFIGVGTIIQGKGGVSVGEDALLGPRVQIYSSDHPSNRASVVRRLRDEIATPIVIERDVWIGAGVIVLRGTTLSEGSVVAAGSIVRTKRTESALFAVPTGLAIPVKWL